MCGIAALVSPSSSVALNPSIVERMTAALGHRGPDSQGVHAFQRCTLGSARLSIVDIAGGKQPILSADGNLGITFNGAIYGFQELKRRLSDYPFRTDTDTEVILALYSKYGEAFPRCLPGMFGFALWDERRQTLICARDRFGEKPLYYALSKTGELLVASEIKAILASGLIEPELNREGLAHYLVRSHTHPGHSIYSNIYPLGPGQCLRFRDGRLRTARYWNPPQASARLTMNEASQRFRELFEASIRKQLVADVPIGVLLSGGVDSSTVAAVASRYQPGIRTFSFGFTEGVESELPYARATARRLGTRHFELADAGIDIADLFSRMQSIYDEPFGDSSNIPTFLICQLARSEVTVALGGDGADELLGGYLFWSRYLLKDPEHGAPSGGFRTRWFGGRRWGSALVRRYSEGFRNYFNAADRNRLGLGMDVDHLIDYSRYRRNSIDDLLRFDAELYLPGDILVKTDRAAMANGLELRAPFLDADLADFCFSLPDSLKVDHEREKLLLRRAYDSEWTPEVRNRPKQGFGSPMATWLETPGMTALKREFLGDRNRRIFSALCFEGVQEFVQRNNQQTWSLLVLALWMERHACSIPAKS